MKPISKLGIGPMSREVVEAVFAYSQRNSTALMLIASKSQVDWDKGYVENWDTKSYMVFINEMRRLYPKAEVFVCRDHLGPGFKNDDFADVYKTVDSDIENGFDLIHVDFCHFKGDYGQILGESKKCIEYILKQKPNIMLEVGTDENTGAFLHNLEKIENEMKYFSSLAPLNFFVCQTGSLVKELGQAGGFNEKFLNDVRQLANKYGLGLKEHNCDYLPAEEIKKRKGLIDAVNVAPQFGVIQTALTLQKAYVYGYSPDEFLTAAYQSGKWQKWLKAETKENKYLCSVIAGHYVFSSSAYRKLYENISRHENFKDSIIAELIRNFDIYITNL